MMPLEFILSLYSNPRLNSVLFGPLVQAIEDTGASANNPWVPRSDVAVQLRRVGQWPIGDFETVKDYSYAAAQNGYVVLSPPSLGGGPTYIAKASGT